MTAVSRCPICASTTTAPFLAARDHASGETFTLQRCAGCGFVFTWPEPANLGDYYPSYYRRYSPALQRVFRFVYDGRTAAWTRALGGSGRALEVGCGDGWMLAALRRRGWKVFGTERTVDSARGAADALQLPVVVGGLEALRSEAGFDLIILHQVLEHLSDPLATLTDCARLLKPGGHLVIGVPNLASWQFQFARQHWFHLDLPRHLGHFTPDSLRGALERVGLRIEHISFVSLEQDPYGWLQSALNRLGFTQQLLLHWLAGADREKLRTPQGWLMLLAAALLAAPSAMLAMLSWLVGRGAIMEVRAVRPTVDMAGGNAFTGVARGQN